MLEDAERIAKEIYFDQYRINGQSYYAHCCDVRNLLKEVGITDEMTLSIALLHHVFHLTDNAEDKLLKFFDKDIIRIIKNYKKLNDIEIKEIIPKELKEDVLIKTYFQLAEDPKLLIVRLADKAINIASAHVLGDKKKIEVAHKALYVYSPICHLIGATRFYQLLEDGGFKILHPQEYTEITKYIKKRKANYTKELANLKKALVDILESEGIAADIEYRVKSPYSVFKKYTRYLDDGLITEDEYNDINDLGAMRVLVDTEQMCYQVESILGQLLSSKSSRRDDYIANPKLSGYQSIHNTYKVTKDVEIEIQIKTHEMHHRNEFGFASHTFYKLGEDFRQFLDRDPDWLKNLTYHEVINKEKIDYFSDNVYVFTPKGDIIELPKGANPLDFAYSLHEDIGHRFRTAFVNGKIVNKEHELVTGDLVEIKTTNVDKSPSRDWLKIVKTNRAKRYITRKLRA